MDSNLSNLKTVLKLGIDKIACHKIDNAVLVIGNTGCGKSTILSALVYESKALELRTITEEVQVLKKGEYITKTLRKKVIDYKDEVRERVFKIGHKTQSETFLPSFQKIPDRENSYYIDMAGLNDTGGNFLEFTNQFINKKLFSLAKNMIFLIPFTCDAFKVDKGGHFIA